MIKKLLIRRISISIITLIIIGILYYFPTNNIQNNYYEKEVSTSMVYLLDKNMYVSKVPINNFDINNSIEDTISFLTKNSDFSIFLPDFFEATIPENTSLLNYNLESGLLSLNFSKELLNVEIGKEFNMIESIVYSLTEFDYINEIMIYVEGNKLTKIPGSDKYLPEILDRSIGINNIYSISSIKNTSTVTIYYLNSINNYLYYVPITKTINSNISKIEIIVDELKANDLDNPNLKRYIDASVELNSYVINENEINLEFKNLIFSQFNEKDITDEARYALTYSIQDSFNVQKVNINY